VLPRPPRATLIPYTTLFRSLQHTLQAIALNHALRRGHALWSTAGQSALRSLPLPPPYTGQRRNELLGLYAQLQKRIQELDQEVRSEEHTSELQSRGHLV